MSKGFPWWHHAEAVLNNSLPGYEKPGCWSDFYCTAGEPIGDGCQGCDWLGFDESKLPPDLKPKEDKTDE